MTNTQQEDEHVAQLKVLVKQFNEGFAQWRERSGMQADFSWSYGRDPFGDEAVKQLGVLSISRTIYRRPPPSAEHMQARLSDLAQQPASSDD